MNSSPKASKPQKPQGSPLSPQENEHLLLERHLQALVDADPQAAREALEMSQEQAPELFQIAQSQPPNQWPQSLMNSDSMRSLMSLNPSQAKALLQAPDLRSLLEMLP